MQRTMLVVGCNHWEEELCEERRDTPGGVRPRLAVGALSGGGAFLSMVLTGSGSMVVAASGRRTVEPKIQ
jgi:hypothetical protein